MSFLYKVFVEVGPISAARCVLGKRKYRRMQTKYGFDPWHASAPFWCRRYKREAVKLVNALRPFSVCDVGCGLGEIIARIDAGLRWGIDRDQCVINAARALHAGINFLPGTLETALPVTAGPIDVLIALNWLHGWGSDQVLELFRPHLRSGTIRYLLMDELMHPTTDQVRHDFAAILSGLAHVVGTSVADPARRLVLMRTRFAPDAITDELGIAQMAPESMLQPQGQNRVS